MVEGLRGCNFQYLIIRPTGFLGLENSAPTTYLLCESVRLTNEVGAPVRMAGVSKAVFIDLVTVRMSNAALSVCRDKIVYLGVVHGDMV